MSIFTNVIKCGICGEPLSGAGNPYTCQCCGNVSYTANPMLEDELRTANAMRECTRFDEAMVMYKQIVKKYKSDDLSEAYWNLLLCEQRVMFETDEKGERFPSFYAVVSYDVEDSPYYTCALSAAEKYAPARVAIFTDMAEKMARAKQLYSRIRKSAKPYDLFICFKKSKLDGSGETTPDTDLAIDLYNHFAKDYNIFFSERSLRDVVVRDFEPNIYYALYTAKVMLILCSKREYVDSQWVKNEWSRYHALTQNPATGKTIIPIFLEDFQPGNLPTELLSYQGLTDGRQLMGALENTLRKILKPLDMEAELNRRMQEMLAEQRRQNEEQQRKMQEQLEAMQRAQEQMASMRKAQEQPKPTAPTPAPQPVAPSPKAATPPKPDFEIVDGVLKKYRGGQKNVVIPDGVTSIGFEAFSFQNVEAVTITDGVKCIDRRAFVSCKRLTSVEIPNSVTSIGEDAFFNCSGIKSITIPEGVTAIGIGAFRECTGLASVIIPKGVTNIGKCAFWGCSGLKSVTLPEGVTSISSSLFNECTGLTSVTIPSSVTSIATYAFTDCKNLKEIILLNSNTVIENNALPEHTVLRRSPAPSTPKATPVAKATPAPEFEIENGVLKKYNGNGGVLVIPDGVICISEKAFEENMAITSVSIPASVTKIGAYAFYNCTNLVEVTFRENSGLTTIGRAAFSGCSQLGDFVFPSSVTSIDGYAFSRSGLKAAIGLSSLTFLGEGAFSHCDEMVFLSISRAPLKSIEKDTFCGCRKLVTITVPPTVTSIGIDAFAWCTSLKSLYLSPVTETIGYGALRACGDNLQEIHCPRHLKGAVKERLKQDIPLAKVKIHIIK